MSLEWKEWLKSANEWAQQSNILLPILLSIVAAIIFWVVFSYVPERKRHKKLRPIVELTLFEIYAKLFSLFDLVMRHASHSASLYQEEIRSGNLSEDDIGLGLQNKCLNESYLYDPLSKGYLLVVGEEMLDRSMAIDDLCNKLLVFHTYATPKELVLLEKIREKIRTYPLSERYVKKHSDINVGGQVLRPYNPSLSYQRRNFYEMYELFLVLQDLVLNRHSLDRARFVYKIQWLYGSGRYRQCAKFIKAQERRFDADRTLARNYLALSERKKGNDKMFYKIMEETYKSRPYSGALAYSRGTLKGLLEDKKLLEMLSRYHSEDEVSALKQAVIEESNCKGRFEKANRFLSDHYKGRAASVNAA